jgi:hypothetical protein
MTTRANNFSPAEIEEAEITSRGVNYMTPLNGSAPQIASTASPHYAAGNTGVQCGPYGMPAGGVSDAGYQHYPEQGYAPAPAHGSVPPNHPPTQPPTGCDTRESFVSRWLSSTHGLLSLILLVLTVVAMVFVFKSKCSKGAKAGLVILILILLGLSMFAINLEEPYPPRTRKERGCGEDSDLEDD